MRQARKHRGGFSFLELVVSLAAATALAVGMASTIGVAMKASNPASTPAIGTLAALNTLSEMAGDLTYAHTLTERTAIVIAATIPDRDDADTNRDTVRYSWSGTPSHPLVRRYNSGTIAIAVPNVYDFSVRYSPASGPVELLFVRIQVSADPRTAVETTIPLLNRP